MKYKIKKNKNCKIEITEHNLLYPRDLPANKRKLENFFTFMLKIY